MLTRQWFINRNILRRNSVFAIFNYENVTAHVAVTFSHSNFWSWIRVAQTWQLHQVYLSIRDVHLERWFWFARAYFAAAELYFWNRCHHIFRHLNISKMLLRLHKNHKKDYFFVRFIFQIHRFVMRTKRTISIWYLCFLFRFNWNILMTVISKV